MAYNFLDKNGLAYAFTKIKSFVSSAVATKAPMHAVAEGITTAGDGAAYTATVEGITALTAGATFMMIPHTVSTSQMPTLNVNGLGAKYLRRRLSNSTVSTVAAASTNWLGANKPVRVIYDGTYWIADFTRPNATDLYGTLAIANGGTGAVTAAAAFSNIVTDASVTRAKLSQDALFSPVISVPAAGYTITAIDAGKTIIEAWSTTITEETAVIYLNREHTADLSPGFCFACEFNFAKKMQIQTDNVILLIPDVGQFVGSITLELERYKTCAFQKMLNDPNYDYWLVTGTVEVVS